MAWAGIQGSRAACLNRLGDHALAKQILEQTRGQMDPANLEFSAINLGLTLEHGLALAGLGETEAAARELDDMLAKQTPKGGKLTLGALHEARANVARLADDQAGWRQHVELEELYFLATNIPSLIARCATQRRELMRGLGLETSGTTALTGFSGATELDLTETKGSVQSDAQVALYRVARAAGATHGALFLLQEHCALLAATQGKVDIPDELAAWVEERLALTEFDDVTETELSCYDNAADPEAFVYGAARYRLHVLSAPIDGRVQVAGAIVLEEPSGARHAVAPLALQMAAEQLLADARPDGRTAVHALE
jgi:hypothetical protein